MLGKDDSLDVATHGEVGDYAHPAWGEQSDEVIKDSVGC